MVHTEVPHDFIENTIGVWGIWQTIITLSVFLSRFAIAFNLLNVVFILAPVKMTCKNGKELCAPDCDVVVYDRSVFEETLVSEFNLVCDRKVLGTFAQVATMSGVLIGNMIFGIWADGYGRKIPFIVAAILGAIFGTISAFVPGYLLYITFRFLNALCTGGMMTLSFVLVVEIVGNKYRTESSFAYAIPFNLGHSLLSLIAYYNRNWRQYIFWQTSVQIVLVFYLCILTESPRWLHAEGKLDETVVVLEKAAKMNGKPTDNIRQIVVSTYRPPSEAHKRGNIWTLIESRRMFLMTLCMANNWFASAITFYGLSQFLNSISGDIFFNVMIAGLLEIPGVIIGYFMVTIGGRKCCLMTGNIIAGAAILFLAFVPPNYGQYEIILACIGIMGIIISFTVCYMYSCEILPTVARSSGMGVCSVAGRIGAIMAPFANQFSSSGKLIPCLIFSILPIIAAFLTTYLPETRDEPSLPDTVEEAENLGR